MRRGGRGEERDTTTHLIKIQVFTHASRVTKFSTFISRRKQRSLEFRLVRPDDGSTIVDGPDLLETQKYCNMLYSTSGIRSSCRRVRLVLINTRMRNNSIMHAHAHFVLQELPV